MKEIINKGKTNARGMPASVQQGARILGRTGGRAASVFGSAKLSDLIIAPESQQEQIIGRIGDLDPRIISVACQPFSLCLKTGVLSNSRIRNAGLRIAKTKSITTALEYTPDFLMCHEDGRRFVIEVKHSRYPGNSDYQAKLSIAKELLTAKGYAFYVIKVSSADAAPIIQNVHLLAAYAINYSDFRNATKRIEQPDAAVDQAKPLGSICDQLRIDLRHAPSLFLTGRYAADFRKERLSVHTMVTPAHGSMRHLELLSLHEGEI